MYKRDSWWEVAIHTGSPAWRSDDLEGRLQGGEGGSRGRWYVYNYDLFALLYGRNQHNIAKPFSSIKKKNQWRHQVCGMVRGEEGRWLGKMLTSPGIQALKRAGLDWVYNHGQSSQTPPRGGLRLDRWLGNVLQRGRVSSIGPRVKSDWSEGLKPDAVIFEGLEKGQEMQKDRKLGPYFLTNP